MQNLTPNHSQPNLELNPTAIQMVWQHSNEWIFYGSLNAILELSIISQAILHIWWQQQQQQRRRGPTGIFSIVNLLFIGIFSSLEFSSQVAGELLFSEAKYFSTHTIIHKNTEQAVVHFLILSHQWIKEICLSFRVEQTRFERSEIRVCVTSLWRMGTFGQICV